MHLKVYLSGEIHTNWREEIIDLVDELNVLWEKANVIMKENMKKDNREPLQ